jgi:hypothetical protein
VPTVVRGTVTNVLVDGQGRGLNNVTVRVSLIAPANPFLLNGIGEVLQTVPADTDHDGTWTAALIANDEFEQAGNYWLVDETEAPGGQKWAIRMPDGGNYMLRDLLVYVPPGSNPTGPTVPGGRFTWNQNSADRIWTIPHNLGFPPVIEAYEGFNLTADSDWIGWDKRRDPDVNTTVLTYLSPVSGRAFCS